MRTSSGKLWLMGGLLGLLCFELFPGGTVSAQDRGRTLSKEEQQELVQLRRLYARGKQAVEAEKYVEALRIFLVTDRMKGDDPRILNMIAYCYQKLGRLDDAFKYYDWTLRAEPDYPDARERLGEAHLQAALVQLRMLQAYGEAGEQGVKDLKSAFRNAVTEMNKPPATEAAEPRTDATKRKP